jgi:Ca2+-binding RTX toxin-like protein
LTINGGAEADVMAGGLGNDIYIVENAGDTIIELASEGEDGVFSSVDFTMTAGAYIEVLGTNWGDGTAPINLTANDLGNSVYGNAGANILNGGGGNDQLVGGAGNDRLNGGTGSDTLNGGSGDDRFVFTGTPGSDTIVDFTSGTDKLDLSAFGITAANVTTATANGNIILSVDSNQNGTADFTITLIGTGQPAGGDYIF